MTLHFWGRVNVVQVNVLLRLFVRESVVVQINVLLRLFVQLPISFSVLLCYNSVDMRVNLGAYFVLILGCLVSDRRELSLSEHKLENLFLFTLLFIIAWCN